MLEHDPDLHAGQVGAQAEVGATGPEGEVGVGVAGDVEGLRVGEDRFVRLAEMWKKTTLVFSSMCWPPRSKALVVWRRKFITGLT